MAKIAKKGHYAHHDDCHDGDGGPSGPVSLAPSVSGIAWDDHYRRGDYTYFRFDYLTPGYDQFDNELFTRVKSKRGPDGSLETDDVYVLQYYLAQNKDTFARESFIDPFTGTLVKYTEESRVHIEQDLTYRGLAEFDVTKGGLVEEAALTFSPNWTAGETVKVDLFLYKADGKITDRDYGRGIKAGSIILDSEISGERVKVDLDENVVNKVLKSAKGGYVGVNFRVDLDDPNYPDDTLDATLQSSVDVARSSISLDLFYI
jgi:hypothetical protein